MKRWVLGVCCSFLVMMAGCGDDSLSTNVGVDDTSLADGGDLDETAGQSPFTVTGFITASAGLVSGERFTVATCLGCPPGAGSVLTSRRFSVYSLNGGL